MKKTIVINDKDGAKEQEVNYIPFRFILAIFLIALETLQEFVNAISTMDWHLWPATMI